MYQEAELPIKEKVEKPNNGFSSWYADGQYHLWNDYRKRGGTMSWYTQSFSYLLLDKLPVSSLDKDLPLEKFSSPSCWSTLWFYVYSFFLSENVIGSDFSSFFAPIVYGMNLELASYVFATFSIPFCFSSHSTGNPYKKVLNYHQIISIFKKGDETSYNLYINSGSPPPVSTFRSRDILYRKLNKFIVTTCSKINQSESHSRSV